MFLRGVQAGRNRKGVALLEYALLAALIALVVVTAVTTIGKNANKTFEAIGDELGKVAGD